MQIFLFYILASIAIISALFVISAKNPVMSACWLILSFLSIAGIYILLNAEFLFSLQVLIYAGAMVVLIVFAVFVINMEKDEYEIKWHLQTPLAYLIGIVLFFEISYVVKRKFFDSSAAIGLDSVNKIGNVEAIAGQLFSKYVLPFEIASVVLLAALIGAVVIAKKENVKEL